MPEQIETFIASMQIKESKKGRTCMGMKDKKTKRNNMQLKRRLTILSMVAIEARHY